MQHQYGQHYTPTKLSIKYKELLLAEYKKGKRLVDPFVGEGNLLLDFLSFFSKDEAVKIIKTEKIAGFDIDSSTIIRLKQKILKLFDIEKEDLDKIFFKNNSLKKNLCNKNDFIFTNPPYLARNVCKRKFPKNYKSHFSKNSFADYYEIALSLYTKNEGIWIIPTNFLSSKKMRETRKFLMNKFNIENVFLFPMPIFKDTRISVLSLSLAEKKHEQRVIKTTFITPNNTFDKKIDIDENGIICKEWEDVVSVETDIVRQGFLRENIEIGNTPIILLNEEYKKETFFVSEEQKELFESNILFLRSIDTGNDNFLGLYTMEELFPIEGKDSISLLTKKTSRFYTPIFFKDKKTIEEQLKIKKEFNKVLQHYRTKYNSIFLTDFKNATKIMQRKRISFKEFYGLLNFIENK